MESEDYNALCLVDKYLWNDVNRTARRERCRSIYPLPKFYLNHFIMNGDYLSSKFSMGTSVFNPMFPTNHVVDASVTSSFSHEVYGEMACFNCKHYVDGCMVHKHYYINEDLENDLHCGCLCPQVHHIKYLDMQNNEVTWPHHSHYDGEQTHCPLPLECIYYVELLKWTKKDELKKSSFFLCSQDCLTTLVNTRLGLSVHGFKKKQDNWAVICHYFPAYGGNYIQCETSLYCTPSINVELEHTNNGLVHEILLNCRHYGHNKYNSSSYLQLHFHQLFHRNNSAQDIHNIDRYRLSSISGDYTGCERGIINGSIRRSPFAYAGDAYVVNGFTLTYPYVNGEPIWLLMKSFYYYDTDDCEFRGVNVVYYDDLMNHDVSPELYKAAQKRFVMSSAMFTESYISTILSIFPMPRINSDNNNNNNNLYFYEDYEITLNARVPCSDDSSDAGIGSDNDVGNESD